MYPPGPMVTRICPQCGTETQAPFCKSDGYATVERARYLGRDPGTREGEVLAGRYRLDQVLGKSTLGTAYRATDLRLNTPIAVRLLAPSIATDLGLIARFQREGRLVASLAHPNIVRVMEHGVAEDGTLFIAQELVAGPTLAEVLTRGGPFDPGRLVAIAKELFDALLEAHTHGVLHRSLGLHNVILLTRAGGGESIKIENFGLVRVLADDDATPFVFPQALSAAWRTMAPEQARGRGVSGHSDLYSAGALLYELLTGKPPFSEVSPSDLLVAHSVKMPPAPERDGRVLVGPLVDLVLRCLEKKPWNRPDGAQKALDLLELARVQPILPMPTTTAEFAAPAAGAGGPTSRSTKRATNPYGVAPTTGRSNAPRVPELTTKPRRMTGPGAAAATPETTPPQGATPGPRSGPRTGPRPSLRENVRTTPPSGPHTGPRPTDVRGDSGALGPARGAGPATGGSGAGAREGANAVLSQEVRRTASAWSDPEIEVKRRGSPVLWFVLGVAVAGIAAAILFATLPRTVATSEVEAEAPTGRAGHDASVAVHEVASPTNAVEVGAVGAVDAVAQATTDTGPGSVLADTAPRIATADTVATDTMRPAAAPVVEKAKEPSRLDKVEPLSKVDPNDKKPVDPLADLEDPDLVKKAAATTHRVLVDSDPVGARVSVHGQSVGETPLYVEWDGEAGVEISVSRAGFKPVRQRLATTSGKSVMLKLVPTP
ncbi:MAG: protein kinase [Deltaproteobacteria bacterium]|nr:protein kinase [Deltaproteobacteria bacterium]